MATDLRRGSVDLRKRGHVSPPARSAPRKRRGGARFLNGSIVVALAVALTTVAIHASDSLRVPGSSLLGNVGSSLEESRCPEDMTYVNALNGGFCVDVYENSPGEECFHADPDTAQRTAENIGDSGCVPASKKDAKPWANVTLAEAQTLCARAGKRLPTGAEWYRAAIGTPDRLGDPAGCVLGRTGNGGLDPSGAHPSCVSAAGAFDMVGNVWEWVDDSVRDGMLGDLKLPAEGFVWEADSDGIPAETGSGPKTAYGGDRMWIEPSGLRGVFRGGYWGMDEKAGVFAMNATQPPSFVGVAVGFRCVK